MTRIARIIKIVLISICLIPSLYFTAVLAGGLITSGEKDAEHAEVAFYLENNGRHIDIWLPAQYCGQFGSGGSGWVSFGWGDRAFYLSTPYAGDLNTAVLLNALFLPSRSVLALEFSETEPAASDLTRLYVSRGGAEAAWDYISSFFLPDEESGVYLRVPGNQVHPSYGGVQFFEAKGRYSIFYTCNNWTGGVLKAAGVSSGIWTPLTFGVYRR